MVTKTIFITSFHILISRNILASKILPLLVEARKTRVVILCPRSKADYFKKEFGSENIIIEPVKVKLSLFELFLRSLSLAAIATASLKIKRVTEMKGSGVVSSKILSGAIGGFLVKILNPCLTPRKPFQEILKKYRPAVVFSTDIMNEADVRIIYAAKRQSIPVVGMVRSWDNLTAKGRIRALPDLLLVNNNVVKDEAVSIHGLSPTMIEVVGIPHYDNYLKSSKLSKVEFFNKIGVAVGKKIALFIPVGDRYLKNNTVDKTVLLLLRGLLQADWEVLVRLPPADRVEEIERNGLPKGITVYRPGGNFGAVKNTELSKEDDDVLIATLAYADLVVTGPSTIAIDAAIFDKPIVLVGFDGSENRPYLESVRRYYDYNHWRPVIQSGGAPLALTP